MREYELEVLEQYDIEVISTRKTRGAYFCDTKEGMMLLAPAGISLGRAPLMYVLLSYLESGHGMKVDTPVFTKEGKLFSVSSDGIKYMLKKWVPGRECEVRRERGYRGICAGARTFASENGMGRSAQRGCLDEKKVYRI